MTRSSLVKTAAIITVSAAFAGCQVINRIRPAASPTPTPVSAFPSPTPRIFGDFNLPTATQSATVSASPKSRPTTKGGQPVRMVAQTNGITTNSLFTTSFDTVEDTNFPGQDQEHTLTLGNKTNSRVLWSVKATERRSERFPITINDSNEATGSIDPQGTGSFRVKTYHSDLNPNFTTSFTINFISPDGKQLSSRTIKVTVHSPANTNVPTIDTDNSGTVSMDARYQLNLAYPIRLVNHHNIPVKFTAQVFPVEARNKFAISAASGTISANNNWLTDVHFTNTDIGSITQININFEFRDEADHVLETRTLTVNIKR